MLRDSAHLQEEDAQYARTAGYSKHAPPLPLYDRDDAERAIERLTPVDFGSAVDVAPGAQVLLRPAGHILGSATAELVIGERRILFTGDLGRAGHPLLRPPEVPGAVDVVVSESTYGDRLHESSERGTAVLADTLRRTLGRGGVVLVPAFAVDRTEVVLHAIARLMRAGDVPQTPVHVDSPMAIAALDVYRRAIRERHPDVRTDLEATGDPFDPGDLRVARSAAESQRLNEPGRPCVIVSASGMATGGRVVHHLEHLLPRRDSCVLLVGYQAVGTRGRDLAEGARHLKMHGRYLPVRAEIVGLPHLSVHADADELVGWLCRLPAVPEVCYAVHGDPAASAALAGRLTDAGWCAVVPEPFERVRLD